MGLEDWRARRNRDFITNNFLPMVPGGLEQLEERFPSFGTTLLKDSYSAVAEQSLSVEEYSGRGVGRQRSHGGAGPGHT